MTPAGRVMIGEFLPSGHAVYLMLYSACFCFILPFFQFPMLSCQVLKAAEIIISSEDGSDRDMETRGAAIELFHG